MTELESDSIIKDGDMVVIKKNVNLKVLQIRKQRPIYMEKVKFFLDGAIGFPYGTAFEVKMGNLVQVEKSQSEPDIDSDSASGIDNRNLSDCSDNQKLSRAELQVMKRNLSGDDIVEQLIENSSTFKDKTEFAQQKYIKKKKKKYSPEFFILRPNTRLLAEMYYNRGASKICNLRVDSFAQLLAAGNVRAGGKFLVVETVTGMLLGAIMERMQGEGFVIQLYSGSAPVRQATQAYNFPGHYYDNVYDFPLNQVHTVKRKKSKENVESSMISSIRDAMEANVSNTGKSSRNMVSTSIPIASEDEDNTISSVNQNRTGHRKRDDTEIEKDSTVTAESVVSAKLMEQTFDENQSGPTERDQYRKRKIKDDLAKDNRKQKRLEKIAMSRCLLEEGELDGLVVCSKFHPTPIVMSLLDFIAPSRPLAVFCQYKEPLLDCFQKLRDCGGIIMLQVTETWFREYQVLSERTHPKLNMSGGGGYLLTATVTKRT